MSIKFLVFRDEVYYVLCWRFLTLKCFELIDYPGEDCIRVDHRDELLFENHICYLEMLLHGEVVQVCYL